MAEEGLVEGSVYAQIKAIEAWALKAKEEAGKSLPTSEDILSVLKNINLQGRKLQWRGAGLKSLPEGKLKKELDRKLSEVRAAAMQAYGNIKHEKKITFGTKKYIKELVKEAIEARKLIELFGKDLSPTLRNSVLTSSTEIEDFLRGEGKYTAYDLDTRRKLWDEWGYGRPLIKLNLSGINLGHFSFKCSFDNCDFSKSNLSGCQFIPGKEITYPAFFKCSFNSADLILANFGSSFINQCTFTEVNAEKANFSGCTIVNSTFSGNFKKANFSMLKGSFAWQGTTSPRSELKLGKIDLEEADFKGATVIFSLTTEPVSFKKADFRESRCALSWEFYGIDKIRDLSLLNFEGAKVNNSRFETYGFVTEEEQIFKKNNPKKIEELKKLFVTAQGTPTIGSIQ